MTKATAPVSGPTERTPRLGELLKAADLQRVLSGFVGPATTGIGMFASDGARFCVAAQDTSPLQGWDQLPAEAGQALARGAQGFGLQGVRYAVRPLYAGADRVGCLVVARDGSPDTEPALADALAQVVGQLLQSGFAAWVTSEMHLAVSANRYREMQDQNAQLQRAVEHLRELDKLKSNFLATVSHELRTPLTSVIGFSEMLLEGIAGELQEEQREYVQTILTRGEELLGLITQVLEMSQLEVGAVRLDLGPSPLAALVERATESLALSAEKAGIELRTELPESLPPVLVDTEKMQRVLTNLVGNAIKFTGAGGRVTVTAKPAPIRRPFREETLFGEEADDALRVTVTDTGEGIPADQLGRIFEAFYQVDAGPTRRHGGAGLGLSIVQSLIAAHGGDVWADSTVGQGTSVHFTIPIART